MAKVFENRNDLILRTKLHRPPVTDDLDREFEAQPGVFTPWFAMEWPRVRTAFPKILDLSTGG